MSGGYNLDQIGHLLEDISLRLSKLEEQQTSPTKQKKLKGTQINDIFIVDHTAESAIIILKKTKDSKVGIMIDIPIVSLRNAISTLKNKSVFKLTEDDCTIRGDCKEVSGKWRLVKK